MTTLLTREEAAQALDVSVDTFDRRIRPHLPFTRIGHRHRWSREDLDKWLASQRVGPYEGRRGARTTPSASPSGGGASSSAQASEIAERLRERLRGLRRVMTTADAISALERL